MALKPGTPEYAQYQQEALSKLGHPSFTGKLEESNVSKGGQETPTGNVGYYVGGEKVGAVSGGGTSYEYSGGGTSYNLSFPGQQVSITPQQIEIQSAQQAPPSLSTPPKSNIPPAFLPPVNTPFKTPMVEYPAQKSIWQKGKEYVSGVISGWQAKQNIQAMQTESVGAERLRKQEQTTNLLPYQSRGTYYPGVQNQLTEAQLKAIKTTPGAATLYSQQKEKEYNDFFFKKQNEYNQYVSSIPANLPQQTKQEMLKEKEKQINAQLSDRAERITKDFNSYQKYAFWENVGTKAAVGVALSYGFGAGIALASEYVPALAVRAAGYGATAVFGASVAKEGLILTKEITTGEAGTREIAGNVILISASLIGGKKGFESTKKYLLPNQAEVEAALNRVTITKTSEGLVTDAKIARMKLSAEDTDRIKIIASGSSKVEIAKFKIEGSQKDMQTINKAFPNLKSEFIIKDNVAIGKITSGKFLKKNRIDIIQQTKPQGLDVFETDVLIGKSNVFGEQGKATPLKTRLKLLESMDIIGQGRTPQGLKVNRFMKLLSKTKVINYKEIPEENLIMFRGKTATAKLSSIKNPTQEQIIQAIIEPQTPKPYSLTEFGEVRKKVAGARRIRNIKVPTEYEGIDVTIGKIGAAAEIRRTRGVSKTIKPAKPLFEFEKGSKEFPKEMPEESLINLKNIEKEVINTQSTKQKSIQETKTEKVKGITEAQSGIIEGLKQLEEQTFYDEKMYRSLTKGIPSLSLFEIEQNRVKSNNRAESVFNPYIFL